MIDKWDERYRAGDYADPEPSPLLVESASDLPPGRALDLACGTGRHALWLAERGWDVVAVDGSAEALRIVRKKTEGGGCDVRSRIRLLHTDLERDPLPFHDDSFDLVLDFLFLHHPLFAEAKRVTKPGGLFVASIHTTRVREMNRAYCLEPGELRETFAGWEIVGSQDDVLADIVARKPHFIHSKTT